MSRARLGTQAHVRRAWATHVRWAWAARDGGGGLRVCLHHVFGERGRASTVENMYMCICVYVCVCVCVCVCMDMCMCVQI